MKKILRFNYLYFSLLAILASCSDDLMNDNEKSKPSPANMTGIEKAKMLFENRYPGAYMLNLTSGDSVQTRSGQKSFHDKMVEVNWEDVMITPYNKGVITEFPVKMPGDIYALKRAVKQGVISHERIRVQTRLVMYESPGNKVSYRIATIIPDKEFYL